MYRDPQGLITNPEPVGAVYAIGARSSLNVDRQSGWMSYATKVA